VIAPPATLAPPAPFPPIVAQSTVDQDVAPGIRRTDYRLATASGPLVVHVVTIDTHDPTVRLDSAIARDRLLSPGETVSAMAKRTGAVAGINADYFDIGNTNQPLNLVVHAGALVRTPSQRATLDVFDDGSVGMGYASFSGSAAFDGLLVPLTAVNEWPPQGGATVLTGAYGTLTAAPGVTVVALQPLDPAAGLAGSYRVTAVGPAVAGPVAGTLLGLGPAAQALAPPPSIGDSVALSFELAPDGLRAAVGGGPLLVAAGAPVEDAQSPAPEERNVRFPVAGAALEPDGTLLLIAVDGRKPAVSIGLTRPEFGALMLGLGAVDGLAFDSGGSATLVARKPGDVDASVLNDPSDGRERPVADGLFAYSSAPPGGRPHLVVRPAQFAAYPGAIVPLRAAEVDAAGRRVRLADVAPLAIDPAPGPHVATVHERDGALSATVAYRTVDRIATLAIVPDRPNPQPGTRLPLALAARDDSGAPVALNGVPVRWTIGARALVAPAVEYDTSGGDVTVSATLGALTVTTPVRVGNHRVDVPAFAETVLSYDFTGEARAAYAPSVLTLPGEPVALGLDVYGDGSGVPLRAAFVNRFGEKSALTLARSVDWTGWRRVRVALPPELNPPVQLTAIYVVRSLGGPPVRAAGTLRLRALAVVLPGSS
jgi:exopolysaccharide biosynthesis protein